MRVFWKDPVLLTLLIVVISLHVLHTEAKKQSKASCGGKIKLSKGKSDTFTSPNYPENYGKKSKCKWRIFVKEEVELNCVEFDLAVTKKCSDKLKIGKTKFCGTSGPSKLAITSKKVTVRFKSAKKSKTESGFSCTIGPKAAVTTISPELNSFTAEQKAKVESALADAASGTCTASGGTCSCSASTDDSFYYEKVLGTQRFIVTSGIPNHNYETGQQTANPNNACPHWTYVVVPAEPTNTGTFTTSGLGAVGIAVSGGYFYNHLSSPQGGVAVVAEGESFDTCNGHSDPSCKYHYHKNPTCLVSGPLACELTGYMFDGFAVYSYCPKPGTEQALTSCYKRTSGDGSNTSHYTFDEDAFNAGTCDLDRANGYTFTTGYAYVFSEDYPFIMPGYYGNLANNCYIS